MEYFTQTQKHTMKIALDAAAVYFGHDSNRLTKIEYAKEELKREDSLPIVCDFVCNLHLIKIAETGYSLNEEAYFTKDVGFSHSLGVINE